MAPAGLRRRRKMTQSVGAGRGPGDRAGPGHEPADFRAYAEHRDPHARERLLRAHLPLANAIARRFDRGDRVPLEDLQQIAALGLIKALDRFDPDNGAAFSSFAVPTMQGEIRRYFRDFTWTVRPPRELQERAIRIEREREQLTTRARPQSHRRRTRPAARLHDRRHPRRHRSRPGPRQRLLRPPSRRPTATTPPRSPTGSEPKTPASPPPKPPPRSTACSPRCPNATRSSCTYASARTSPKPKSAGASAARRCTSRASCAPPSPNSPSTHKPPPRSPERNESSCSTSTVRSLTWRALSLLRLPAHVAGAAA